MAWLRDPNYDTLKLRLEIAHAAVEAHFAAKPRTRKARWFGYRGLP